jgi:Common central domain of tyrosinase
VSLGDDIRRNIASEDPGERGLLHDALIELNHRYFPGNRADHVPRGVNWWFEQDEFHQVTHVHGDPDFPPWHREIVNRLEAMLPQINPQLLLHYRSAHIDESMQYWDWCRLLICLLNEMNLSGEIGERLENEGISLMASAVVWRHSAVRGKGTRPVR